MRQPGRILLIGISGIFNGERYLIGEGASVIVGRSRSCDVSAARTRVYRRVGGNVLNRDRAFLKMSRRHFQVFFDSGDSVRLRDLSTNGIKVDGERVGEVVFTADELEKRRVLLTFGNDEAFLVSCVRGNDRDAAGSESIAQETSPSSSGFEPA